MFVPSVLAVSTTINCAGQSQTLDCAPGVTHLTATATAVTSGATAAVTRTRLTVAEAELTEICTSATPCVTSVDEPVNRCFLTPDAATCDEFTDIVGQGIWDEEATLIKISPLSDGNVLFVYLTTIGDLVTSVSNPQADTTIFSKKITSAFGPFNSFSVGNVADVGGAIPVCNTTIAGNIICFALDLGTGALVAGSQQGIMSATPGDTFEIWNFAGKRVAESETGSADDLFVPMKMFDASDGVDKAADIWYDYVPAGLINVDFWNTCGPGCAGHALDIETTDAGLSPVISVALETDVAPGGPDQANLFVYEPIADADICTGSFSSPDARDLNPHDCNAIDPNVIICGTLGNDMWWSIFNEDTCATVGFREVTSVIPDVTGDNCDSTISPTSPNFLLGCDTTDNRVVILDADSTAPLTAATPGVILPATSSLGEIVVTASFPSLVAAGLIGSTKMYALDVGLSPTAGIFNDVGHGKAVLTTAGGIIHVGSSSNATQTAYQMGAGAVPEFSLTTMLLAVLISGFVLMFVIRKRK